jgi:predicted transcriptional regulator
MAERFNVPSQPSKNPTELELEILKVLWRIGPATVRQVRDELAPFRELAYTTVMTMMSIMHGKGYLSRVKDGRTYVYRSIYREEKASRGLLKDVIDRVFGGSTAAVMQHLLETSELDDDELKQIRLLIDRKSQEKSDSK